MRRFDISSSILRCGFEGPNLTIKLTNWDYPTDKELKTEIQRLEAENKRLEIVCAILKKAAALFANESN